MTANVFISYDHLDQDRVNGFISLINNPNHSLSFHDWSLKDPIVDKIKKPLPYPPSDPRSKPVKKEIKYLFKKTSRMVVLIGEYTYLSEWVNWEIQTFFDNKAIMPGITQNRIRALRFKGYEKAILPPNLQNRSGGTINWDLEELSEWLNNPV
jgi:hypothetical protein